MQPVIGLEIHVQLKTKSKMFCSCSNNAEGAEPNTLVCPVCMGHPGTLPVLNKQAFEYGLMMALALECEIPTETKFDRKNYFYPDLPKGYQISQHKSPIGNKGKLEFAFNGGHETVNFDHIHLEEDAGKLIHEGGDSLVDYNRSSTPLLEMVTKPVIQSPEVAKAFLQSLKTLVKTLGISDADMEKGHLRCDANVSLQEDVKVLKNPKAEIKNLNSFKAIEKALRYEIKRQKEIYRLAKIPNTSTMEWDTKLDITKEMRSKEDSPDYRYFPEPDLPPIVIAQGEDTKEKVFINLEVIKTHMPELPQDKIKRMKDEYGLKEQDIVTITSDPKLAEFFEQALSEAYEWGDKDDKEIPKLVSNWLLSEMLGVLKDKKMSLTDLPMTPENFAELVIMVKNGDVNSSAGQSILLEMIENGGDPSQIVEEKGLKQVSDEGELETIISKVIKANGGPVEDYKNGKEAALQFLVGKVMKESKGSANPQKVMEMLKMKL
ncbi:MAG: Asp-tRNA(Asn)/Glu-tRNA(Gln) amidotransferase subunit GatB [bacterium]